MSEEVAQKIAVFLLLSLEMFGLVTTFKVVFGAVVSHLVRFCSSDCKLKYREPLKSFHAHE